MKQTKFNVTDGTMERELIVTCLSDDATLVSFIASFDNEAVTSWIETMTPAQALHQILNFNLFTVSPTAKVTIN